MLHSLSEKWMGTVQGDNQALWLCNGFAFAIMCEQSTYSDLFQCNAKETEQTRCFRISQFQASCAESEGQHDATETMPCRDGTVYEKHNEKQDANTNLNMIGFCKTYKQSHNKASPPELQTVEPNEAAFSQFEQ